MAKDCKDILLIREGTSQSQRFLKALNPEYLKLHDFSAEDWVLFAYSFAHHVNFFETNDHKVPDGNWEELFNLFELPEELPFRGTPEYQKITENVKKILDDFKKDQALTPHLTLFVSFLELLSLSQNRFNKLTQRHLDFYYKEVLQIEKELPKPDQAHIIFELAKRIEDYKVEQGTELDAGKDPNGANLVFETLQELIANRATVGSIKSIYNDTKDDEEIKAAPIANSHDGNGAEFPDENTFWHPFGYTSRQKEFPKLEAANMGFTLASPMLALAEGERNVSLHISFDPPTLSPISAADLIENVDIYYTGEKKWEGPLSLQEKLIFLGSGANDYPLVTEGTEGTLKLVFQLDRDMKPWAGYNPEVHLENYPTSDPLVKVVFKTNTKKGYSIFRNVVHQPVAKITVEVSVSGVQSLNIENDTGVLKPNKPFYPFTTQPTRRSNFYIDYPELFSKNWGKLWVDLLWKGTPSSFKSHYEAYRTTDTNSLADYTGSIFISEGDDEADNQPEDGLENDGDGTTSDARLMLDPDPANLIVTGDDYFKVSPFILHKELWDERPPAISIFNDDNEDGLFNTYLELDNDNYTLGKAGPVRLALNQSFLQELFPKIYALALASTDPNTLIPNAPYIPFVETISLNYSAKEFTDFTVKSEESYEDNRIRLFLHSPFG